MNSAKSPPRVPRRWAALYSRFWAPLSIGRTVAVSVLVGLVSGLGAILFDVLSQCVFHLGQTGFAGLPRSGAAGEPELFQAVAGAILPWRLLLVLGTGGLVSGWLVFTFAPEAEGHGTDAVIDAFHNRSAVIRTRVPWVKTLASIITLGSGGSGGREGPIAQIGAGFGSWLAVRLNLSMRERRTMLAAGMGAGIGAIFRTPLAGAVFAGEILYSDADIETEVLVPAATSSIVAYGVYTQVLPPEYRFLPLFGNQLDHQFTQPRELVLYALLAFVLTATGAIYTSTFYGMKSLFARLPTIPHVKPAIGAMLAGAIVVTASYAFGNSLYVLGALGTGYGSLQVSLTDAGQVGVTMLLTLAALKIVTTSLTISSGGSGGVFGPSMVIGGSVGAAMGLLFQAWFPQLVEAPEAYTVVGMAGFFAGVARAPLSTIIMVRSLTGDYGLLVPTMLVTTMTFLMSRRWTLYRKQVANRLVSPAHRGDFVVDILKGILVEEVFDRVGNVELIRENMSLEEIVRQLARNQQHCFPVVDAGGDLVGMFSDNDIRAYIVNQDMWHLVCAQDLMSTNPVYVTPKQDLHDVLTLFTGTNVDELPVVASKHSSVLLGMLQRKAILSAYHQKLVELKGSWDWT